MVHATLHEFMNGSTKRVWRDNVMSELPAERPGFTARSVTIGLALVLVWLLYDCTLAVHPGLATIEMLYLIGFGAAFTVFGVQAVNNAVSERRRLSMQEMTVIYAMVAVAIPWGILIRSALEAPLKIAVLHTGAHDPAGGWLTSWWGTKSRDAIDLFRRGGVMPWDIPWREYRKPILYWGAILLSFQFFALSAVLLFRRIFIDEEKLPFPLAQVGASIIEYRPSTSAEEGARKFRNAVRIAFVAGLVFCLPAILSVTPEGYSPLPMNASYYGTNTGIIPGLSVTLCWDPFILCFLMFFPIDVLFTVTVFYVGLNIVVPVVFHWIGLPTPQVGVWTLHILGMGGLVGLAFWPAFFNRKLLARGIRRAFSGGSSPGDPISMRVIVFGMALSLTAFVALFVLGVGDIRAELGRHVISITLCLVVILAMLFSHMRLMGEGGWHYHSPWSVGKVITYSHYHFFTHPARLFKTQASFLQVSHVLHFGAYHTTFAPHLYALDALKVASQTNTSPRDVMKGVVLTLLVSLVLVIPGYLVAVHYYGFEHGATAGDWHNFFNYSQPQHAIAYAENPTFFNHIKPWVSVPIGVALIGIVMYVRREHVGFPLSPVGIVLAAGYSYFGNYGTGTIWLPILIVLLLKRVVYRWFGVKFFREKALPVVLYVMMGLMTGMFIYKIIFTAMGRGFMRPY